jgi:hypothetical protein
MDCSRDFKLGKESCQHEASAKCPRTIMTKKTFFLPDMVLHVPSSYHNENREFKYSVDVEKK